MEATQFIAPLLLAAAAAALSTPLVARLALRLGVVDQPGERKVSERLNIPLLGGVAVAIGCTFGLVAIEVLIGIDSEVVPKLIGFGIGSVMLIAIGAWDDRFYLGAWQKIPVQVLAACVAIYSGFRVEFVTDPFTLTTYTIPAVIGWAISLFWIVGVTNAMNLIDGLDGLSSGIGAIIAATMVVICFQADQIAGVVLGVAMLGALLGYLPFNFPPARIFLGDAGALFIGFALSLLSLQGYRKAALMTFIVPLLALAVPLLDTMLSVVRRLRMGKGIFDADRMHMHHRLLAKEGSQRRAVLWLYFQTACFSIIAISFAQLEGYSAFAFLAAVFVLTVRLLRNLGLFSIEADGEKVAEVPDSAEGEKT